MGALEQEIAWLNSLVTIVEETRAGIWDEYRAMVGKADVEIPGHMTPGLEEAVRRSLQKALAKRGLK